MDTITKEHRDIREKIARDTEEFLKKGGVIQEIEMGRGEASRERELEFLNGNQATSKRNRNKTSKHFIKRLGK